MTRFEEMKVKTPIKAAIFVLISSAIGLAQTPNQLGAWSVSPADSNLTRNHVVMLQSASEQQFKDSFGNPVQAKLDIICKKGKLSAIALEPNVRLQESAVSVSGAVPTTRVAFTVDGQNNESENWAVLDDGNTVSPYSEVFQGKLMKHWIERISNTDKITFQLVGEDGQATPTFATRNLIDTLSSVGCKY
jgi:hypothetical protein